METIDLSKTESVQFDFAKIQEQITKIHKDKGGKFNLDLYLHHIDIFSDFGPDEMHWLMAKGIMKWADEMAEERIEIAKDNAGIDF